MFITGMCRRPSKLGKNKKNILFVYFRVFDLLVDKIVIFTKSLVFQSYVLIIIKQNIVWFYSLLTALQKGLRCFLHTYCELFRRQHYFVICRSPMEIKQTMNDVDSDNFETQQTDASQYQRIT